MSMEKDFKKLAIDGDKTIPELPKKKEISEFEDFKESFYTFGDLKMEFNACHAQFMSYLREVFDNLDIEKLSELVHKAYCQYQIDIKGKEYWTKGDYSKLTDEVKEADRYTVRAIKFAIHNLILSEGK